MNWISVRDKLPESSDIEVLAFCKNSIYPGHFRAFESWTMINGTKEDYKKIITFEVSLYLNKNYCDGDKCINKECSDQCVDCCEKDYEIALLMISFPLNEVTHWMQIEPPKDIK